MKKINIKNAKGLNIVGNLSSVGSDRIIIMAHGFTNNKSSDGRYDELALALNKNGYDALAIDFSGCGESDDADLTVQNQIDDLNSTIDYVLENEYKKIGLFGNSLGTLVCLKCYSEHVITMVLAGALTDSVYYDWDEYFQKSKMKELTNQGYFYLDTPRKHKITKQTLKDFEEINQNTLLKDIDCPILIIHGNDVEDTEEQLLLENSQRAAELIKGKTQIDIIENGKHGLKEHWNDVIETTCKWFNQYLED